LFCKPAKHQAACSYVDESFGVLGFGLIVFGKAAVSAEPRKGALDHPASGKNLKTSGERSDDFDASASPYAQLLEPLLELA
jgi:hypothetical protein